MSIKLKEYILEVLYKTREDKLNKQYNQIFEEQSRLVNDKNIIIIYNNKQYFPLNITPKTERILVPLDSNLKESFNTVITNKDKLESNREVLKEYLDNVFRHIKISKESNHLLQYFLPEPIVKKIIFSKVTKADIGLTAEYVEKHMQLMNRELMKNLVG